MNCNKCVYWNFVDSKEDQDYGQCLNGDLPVRLNVSEAPKSKKKGNGVDDLADKVQVLFGENFGCNQFKAQVEE